MACNCKQRRRRINQYLYDCQSRLKSYITYSLQSMQEEQDPRSILHRPIIIIESSEEEQHHSSSHREHKEAVESLRDNNTHLTLWENDEPEQRLTLEKMQSFTQLMEQEERKEKEDRQKAHGTRPDMASLSKEREKKRKEEQQLKKEFSSFAYLSVDALKKVKRIVQGYEPGLGILPVTSAGCKEEVKWERVKRIKEMTKNLLLLIEVIRKDCKVNQQTELQRQILDLSLTEVVSYCQTVSLQIEENMFRKLFSKGGTKGKEYQRQLQVVMQQLKDRNNSEFHRKVLSRDRANLQTLHKKSENELKCAKTKAEEAEKMRQLVRESENIKESIQKDMVDSDEQDLGEAQRQQALKDESMRLEAVKSASSKVTLAAKNKQIVKATFKSLRKMKREMKDRREHIDRLLSQK